MRAGLFVLIFALLVTGAMFTGSDNLAFVLYFSAALAAIAATVMTASGRGALRRIRRNLTQGWSGRNPE
ncbi:hypothetical protein EV640_10310 [Nesterenkonia aurantiaca]|uniref:Uncharacterized protein n=1 Tax=Nesterenkonia aurantiaca TaxID=1436010 RepID=A0A4V3ECG1_9MICC|nr:hypothetical protein EV640_10310 [Nesterenkonia aurantiaca]